MIISIMSTNNNFINKFMSILSEENPGCIFNLTDISINRTLRAAEDIIADHKNEAFLEQIDCKKGCGDCCILNIPVLAPEVFNIKNFIEKNLSSRKRKTVFRKVKELSFPLKNIDDEERIACRKECVLLNDDKSCSVYEVRPILCRSVTSTSREKCKESLDSVITGGENKILMNTFIKNLYDDLFKALSSFLLKHNLDNRSCEIIQSLKKEYSIK